MNKSIQVSVAVATFATMFFVGKQVDLSKQVFAVYESFQANGVSSSTQKASVSEY